MNGFPIVQLKYVSTFVSRFMTEEPVSLAVEQLLQALTYTAPVSSIASDDQRILEGLEELKTVYEGINDTEKRADYQPNGFVFDNDNIGELYSSDIRGIISLNGKVCENTALCAVNVIHDAINKPHHDPDINPINEIEERVSTKWFANCKIWKDKMIIELTKLK